MVSKSIKFKLHLVNSWPKLQRVGKMGTLRQDVRPMFPVELLGLFRPGELCFFVFYEVGSCCGFALCDALGCVMIFSMWYICIWYMNIIYIYIYELYELYMNIIRIIIGSITPLASKSPKPSNTHPIHDFDWVTLRRVPMGKLRAKDSIDKAQANQLTQLQPPHNPTKTIQKSYTVYCTCIYYRDL